MTRKPTLFALLLLFAIALVPTPASATVNPNYTLVGPALWWSTSGSCTLTVVFNSVGVGAFGMSQTAVATYAYDASSIVADCGAVGAAQFFVNGDPTSGWHGGALGAPVLVFWTVDITPVGDHKYHYFAYDAQHGSYIDGIVALTVASPRA